MMNHAAQCRCLFKDYREIQQLSLTLLFKICLYLCSRDVQSWGGCGQQPVKLPNTLVQSNIWPEESHGATGAGLNDSRWFAGLWKTHMPALNRHGCTRDDETLVKKKNTGEDWKCLNGLGAICFMIQIYIAKKLGSNCLTLLPAACFILISFIGHLICSCVSWQPLESDAGSERVLGSFLIFQLYNFNLKTLHFQE